MRIIYSLLFFSIFAISCSSQEKTSTKVFSEIALVNKIQFYDSKLDQPRFSCGFLLKFNKDTFAVTAKHLLKIIKPEKMTTLSFEGHIKSWSLYVLDKPNEVVNTNVLLNENRSERLADKKSYVNDWLVFSLKDNHTAVKALEIRTTPLVSGEKLYVIGWTRKMESGAQRVYEFEYFKTTDNRILLKDVIVPGLFGGLSGAPVVDEKGKLVGIVSGSTADPADPDKKYFSPCTLDGLVSFLEKYQSQ